MVRSDAEAEADGATLAEEGKKHARPKAPKTSVDGFPRSSSMVG